jgi:hypothetical protein
MDPLRLGRLAKGLRNRIESRIKSIRSIQVILV